MHQWPHAVPPPVVHHFPPAPELAITPQTFSTWSLGNISDPNGKSKCLTGERFVRRFVRGIHLVSWNLTCFIGKGCYDCIWEMSLGKMYMYWWNMICSSFVLQLTSNQLQSLLSSSSKTEVALLIRTTVQALAPDNIDRHLEYFRSVLIIIVLLYLYPIHYFFILHRIINSKDNASCHIVPSPVAFHPNNDTIQNSFWESRDSWMICP